MSRSFALEHISRVKHSGLVKKSDLDSFFFLENNLYFAIDSLFLIFNYSNMCA
jgi:hypothetical protein